VQLPTADCGAGAIRRPRLLDLLRDDALRVVSIAAPAGYGKTALLRSWPQDVRPFVYAQPSGVRDEGSELLFRVRRALDTGRPYVLAVDGIGAPSPSLLMSLFLHVHSAPVGSLLLLSSRRPVDWGHVIEVPAAAVRHIGPTELAFTPDEAMSVLMAAGVAVDRVDASRLFARARGWPIAHYLSALLLAGVPEPETLLDEIVADDSELARGLVARLLTHSAATTRRFLMRTSILMNLSGPLCDWLLYTSGSEPRLAELAERNLLVTPVPGQAGTYQYQRLFAELLRAELNDRRPDAASCLHLRAAEWYAGRGDEGAAQWHRQAARTSARDRVGAPYVTYPIVRGRADLTLAELQVLAFLPSHLSFQDIGVRLGRSGNAIQRLAIGIYRKLGVISRRDAVERGLVLGLVRVDEQSALATPT